MIKGNERTLEGRRPRRPQTARTLSLQLCMLALATIAHANSQKLFMAGNKALAEGRFDDAINAYMEAAADAPESVKIHFNLGNAQYKAEAFDEAAVSYEYAASLAGTDTMRSRSWYNLGNCMVKTGESLREADPQIALSYYRQAAWLYRIALDFDANFTDAAYNLEISQHITARIGKEIREQEQKEQQQNELAKYIREKLQELIERQSELLETLNTGEPQKALEEETRELAKLMEASGLHTDIEMPDGTAMAGPLRDTFGHTVNAAGAMVLSDQPTALAELIAALNAAPEDPDQQNDSSDESSEDDENYDMDYGESDEDAGMYEDADPFGDFSEYEEIRGVPPPNQTEMDILTEEIRNQERRKKKMTGEYKATEKDW